MVKLYGFTFLRNGVSHDYSFRESLLSLHKFCPKVFVALGANDDGTGEALRDLSFLEIIPTVWDMSRMGDGGLIFSEQTNIALSRLRSIHGEESGAWGIYLQCDEVIHEEDSDLLIRDLQFAEDYGYDAVRFRYLHFWQDHQHIAINKIWYPQEIRALKLGSMVESWGDAQSFRKSEKILESDVRVYHYGHVRDAKKYAAKKDSIIRFIRPEHKLGKYKRRELRSHTNTEVIDYLGDHPAVMRDRILRLGDPWNKEIIDEIWIVGHPQHYSPFLLEKINARKINWVEEILSVPIKCRSKAVVMEPGILSRLFYPSRVPVRMRSKLALPWPNDFLLTLKLSEKGISLRQNQIM